MPRSCTICEHPKREAIDRALVGGASNRSLASLYDVSEAAVRRHRTNHLPARMVMAQEAAEIVHADTLLDDVRGLQVSTLAILARAELSGELRVALSAIREARGNLELLAKMVGELDERPTVSVLMGPAWLEARGRIVAALDGYPDAKGAVLKALESARANG